MTPPEHAPTAAEFVRVHKHPPRAGNLVAHEGWLYRWGGRAFDPIVPAEGEEGVDTVSLQLAEGIAVRGPVTEMLVALVRCSFGLDPEQARETVATFCEALREAGWKDATGVGENSGPGVVHLTTLSGGLSSYQVDDIAPIVGQLMSGCSSRRWTSFSCRP